MSAKNEKELDKIINEASPEKVRQVLSYICHEWWVVNEKTGELDFDKEINSDTLENVTSILHTAGFCPKEN